MKILAFIFCALVFACGARLEDIKINSNSDFLEIIFLLDNFYEKHSVLRHEDDFSVLMLDGILFDEKFSANADLIKNIEIFHQNGILFVVLPVRDFALKYELQSMRNKNILKFIIKKRNGIASNLAQNSRGNALDSKLSLEDSINLIKAQNAIPTEVFSIASWRYVLVVVILSLLILALFIIKKKLKSPPARFAMPQQASKKLDISPALPNISVTQTIDLDLYNKIFILDSPDFRYILFVGQGESYFIDKIPRKSKNVFANDDSALDSSHLERISPSQLSFLSRIENKKIK